MYMKVEMIELTHTLSLVGEALGPVMAWGERGNYKCSRCLLVADKLGRLCIMLSEGAGGLLPTMFDLSTSCLSYSSDGRACWRDIEKGRDRNLVGT